MAEHASFRFPDGISGTIRLQRQRAPRESRYWKFAAITIEGIGQLELNECIDTGPNNDEPLVHIVLGNPADQILLFGGEIIYVVSSKGQVIKELPTFRKRRNDKFWPTEVVRLNELFAILLRLFLHCWCRLSASSPPAEFPTGTEPPMLESNLSSAQQACLEAVQQSQ